MKTIINIVSAQTLPNYLFIQEMYEPQDKIVWIVTKKMKFAMQYLRNALPNVSHEEIIIDDEDNLKQTKKELKDKFRTENLENSCYCVNLTGGTKILSLSVYEYFKENHKQTNFYYISIDKKNTIINVDTQEEIPIKYRININEYFTLYGLSKKEKDEKATPYLSFDAAKHMYSLLESGVYQKEEIKTLRERRYKDQLKLTLIKDLKDESIKDFIVSNKFPTKEAKKIDKHDVKYIVGEWLEDLIFYITEYEMKPDSILKGIHIYKDSQSQSDQELDVVYTKDNEFFIRECKTGFEKESMFNEIVYKSAAIKTLFGLGMKSSIYCCREKLDDDEKTVSKMNETLTKMGITYFGKKDIDNELNKLN